MAVGLAALWAAVHASGTTGSLWELTPGLFLDGMGMGMVIAPLTHTALATVRPELVGAASGVVATVQQIGGALGIALIGIVFYGAAGDGATGPLPARLRSRPGRPAGTGGGAHRPHRGGRPDPERRLTTRLAPLGARSPHT